MIIPFPFGGGVGAGEPAVFLYGDCLNRFDRGGARGWWGRTVSGGMPGGGGGSRGAGGITRGVMGGVRWQARSILFQAYRD